MVKTTPCVKIPCGFAAGFFIFVTVDPEIADYFVMKESAYKEP